MCEHPFWPKLRFGFLFELIHILYDFLGIWSRVMANNMVSNTPTVCNSKRSITNAEHLLTKWCNENRSGSLFGYSQWYTITITILKIIIIIIVIICSIEIYRYRHTIIIYLMQSILSLCVTHHMCLHEWDFVWIRFTSNWTTRIREFLFVQFICRKCSRSINSNLHTFIHKRFAFSQTPVWLRIHI